MLKEYGLDIDYVVIGLLLATVVIFIILLITLISLIKLKKKYKQFMGGKDSKTLEESFIDEFRTIDAITEENKIIKVALKKLSENQKKCYSKMSLVKYDAFDETSGKLSFVLALLNDDNNGIVINSVYSTRSGCYVYAKDIINGESYKVLTDEERVALKEVMKNDLTETHILQNN